MLRLLRRFPYKIPYILKVLEVVQVKNTEHTTVSLTEKNLRKARLRFRESIPQVGFSEANRELDFLNNSHTGLWSESQWHRPHFAHLKHICRLSLSHVLIIASVGWVIMANGRKKAKKTMPEHQKQRPNSDSGKNLPTRKVQSSTNFAFLTARLVMICAWVFITLFLHSMNQKNLDGERFLYFLMWKSPWASNLEGPKPLGPESWRPWIAHFWSLRGHSWGLRGIFLKEIPFDRKLLHN